MKYIITTINPTRICESWLQTDRGAEYPGYERYIDINQAYQQVPFPTRDLYWVVEEVEE